ncbi:hypothetical protein NGM99_00620 [Mesorhizobium sp. RP14(2022)]|uniref:Uncharacterized protein n=1 Tax=Mesorhizobium liriopis TaxID=2953882 RepID=A0ABT1C1C4_9HYPH|nr:hypothetical protein [Mesorhizobium liriopis]
MNTANLQLEGLYLALAALMGSLRRHDILSESAIDAALAEAERAANDDSEIASERSEANRQAVAFPIRLLRLANAYGTAEMPSFSELAARVGQHNHQNEREEQ